MLPARYLLFFIVNFLWVLGISSFMPMQSQAATLTAQFLDASGAERHDFKLGDPIKVVIGNIPIYDLNLDTSARYDLTITPKKGSGPDGTPKDEIFVDLNFDYSSNKFTCVISQQANPSMWSQAPTCSPQNSFEGPFTVTGTIDSSKLGVDSNVTTDTVFYLGITTAQSGQEDFGYRDFVIKASQASPPVSGSTPSLYKIVKGSRTIIWDNAGGGSKKVTAGDTVTLLFSNAKTNTEYTWGVKGDSNNPKGTCTPVSGSCFVNFQIPATAIGSVIIGVRDVKAGKATYSGSIEVISPTQDSSGRLEVTQGDPIATPTDTPTPTPLPPRPPCKKGLKYNFDINNPYTKPADTTTNNAKIDLCTDYNSAFGTISTDTSKFVKKFFAILLSLSGGIVLLLLIYSGYQILTSQGNADRLKAARERITSAIIGLLFMIFSLVILQVIGVDILNLPGFGK